MSSAPELVFRTRVAGDQAFLVRLGKRAFARWARDGGEVVWRMVNEPRAITRVVTHGGEPVGFAVATLAPLGRPYAEWASPAVARLDAIAVDTESRRRGVARELLAHVQVETRERGAVVMTLMTAESNRAGRITFERSGFLPVLRLPGAYSNGEPAIEMFKPLA